MESLVVEALFVVLRGREELSDLDLSSEMRRSVERDLFGGNDATSNQRVLSQEERA